MKTYLDRASNLKPTITFLAFIMPSFHSGSQFLVPVKKFLAIYSSVRSTL